MRYVMDNSFLTGCEPVDIQHSQLFDAINSLLDTCEQKADHEALQKSLDFLSDYTVKHFFDEEQLLKKNGFSDFDHHHQYHEAFKKTVRELSHEFIFKGISAELVQSVQGKIGAWLIEHIKGQDFRWAKELKEKAPDLFTGSMTVPPTAPAADEAAHQAGDPPASLAAAHASPPALPIIDENDSKIAGKIRGGIRAKIFFLMLLMSLAALAGFGIFVYNGFRMRQIDRTLTERFANARSRDSFSRFNAFLDAAQASAGISQNLGETFYLLKDSLGRRELAAAMEAGYHRAFARETSLRGGGAFYEPRAFYPDVYDFHYFDGKALTAAGVPAEKDAQWLGSEWEWDIDTYEESWYQLALPKNWDRSKPREGRYYWSDLYVDNSVNALMVSVCLPLYDPAKRIVGVATVDVSLAALQKMVASFELPTPSAKIAGFSTLNRATFAIGGSAVSGTAVGDSAVGGNADFNITPYPKDSWLSRLEQLKPGQIINEPDFVKDGVSYTLSASVHESGMGLALLIPNAEQFAAVDALQTVNLITALAAVLAMAGIIVIVSIAFSRWILRPVNNASQLLENLARGDLTRSIKVKGADELSRMTGLLARTQEGIRDLVRAIDKKARTLSSVGTELQNMMSGAAAVINQINANTQDMKSKSANQAEGVVETNTAVGQIISNIENLNGHIEKQAESVSRSSASIEEMISNITAITASLAQNDQELRRLRESSSQGNAALQKVSADIQEVSKESERLLEINKVIQNIASQTNLLAMNAAIEAAHAGDVGRGFAVVADEIRKLAESSSEQAKTVSGVLKNIKDALGGISSSTLASLRQFEEIDSGFEAVSAQGMKIRNAMEQQDAGNKEVLESMETSNEITRNVRNNSSEIQNRGREVINEGRNLETLTGEVTGAINEIGSGIENINAAIIRTGEISRKNKEDIEDLLREITRFKIE